MGEIPITKNENSLSIRIVDEKGKEIGKTYQKRANGLIKKGRAKLIDKNTICLFESNNMEGKLKSNDKPKGLSKIIIPNYSKKEELISSISHGFGVFISIAILVLCIVRSSIHHNVYAVVSSCLYGSMSIILYMMSTLYHSFRVNNAKRVFRIIDHCSIYLLIAGTYTPYALVTLRESNVALGWTIFGVVWFCAIVGIVMTAIDMNKFKKLGLLLYLIMGWGIVFTFKTLLNNMHINGIIFMIVGGITYTIGSIIYVMGKKVKYMHSLFHFFVVMASVLFFFSIFFYVI